MSQFMRTRNALPVVILLLVTDLAVAQGTDCTPSDDPAVIKQAEQKLVLLQRMVGAGGPAQRVDEGNSEEAKQVLEQARNDATRASLVLDEGCGAEAVALATSGLGLASKAFALAKNRGPRSDAVYREVHGRTTSFLQSLEAQPADVRGIGDADIAGMHRQIQSAEQLAVSGDYESASRLLKPVVDRLERRLVAIYDQKTVYYEKSFDGPEDEYAYLAQQYQGYQMVLDRFAGSKQPPHSAKQMYDKLLATAAGQASAAEGHAQASDWDTALAKIQEAVTNCERAMRLIGIGY
jgi:hypothetical protein